MAFLPLPSPLGHSLQVDSILFAEFQAWKESPTLEKSCSFLDRIYREDVGPCLDFTKQEVSAGKAGAAGSYGVLPSWNSSLSPLFCCSCQSWCEWLWNRTPLRSSQWLPRLSLWARWQQKSVAAPSKDCVSLPCPLLAAGLSPVMEWCNSSLGPPHTSRSDVIFQTKRRGFIQILSIFLSSKVSL